MERISSIEQSSSSSAAVETLVLEADEVHGCGSSPTRVGFLLYISLVNSLSILSVTSKFWQHIALVNICDLIRSIASKELVFSLFLALVFTLVTCENNRSTKAVLRGIQYEFIAIVANSP